MDFFEELRQAMETVNQAEDIFPISPFEELVTGQDHTAPPAAPPSPLLPPLPPSPLLPPLPPSPLLPPLNTACAPTFLVYVRLFSPVMSVIPIHSHPPVPPVTPVPPVPPVTPVTPVPAVPQAAAEAKLPYIKKPPNAFMVFRKEQRPNVVAQHHVSNCATVNKILGEMWNSMNDEDKEKYFVLSRMEAKRHKEQHPEWEPNNKKRKKC